MQASALLDRQNIQVRVGQRVDLTLSMQVASVTESGGGQGRVARDRHVVHDNRRHARQRAPEQRSGGPPIQRRALPRARRQQRRSGRPGEPVDCRRQRPREQLRRRRREHHERRLRRARVVLDRVRIARQRSAVRFHQGSAGARPAATRPSTARPPAASSTSSRRAGRTSCAAASSDTTGRTAWRAAYKQVQTTNGTVNIDRHARRRLRRRSGRADRSGQGVLLRRDRSAVESHALRRAGRLPATEPGSGASGSAHHAVRGQGDVAGDADAADRRVVLRRPGARRQRAAALHGALEPGHGGLQQAGHSTAGTTRPSSTKARSMASGCVEGSFARAANNLVEVPSVDQWSVTDDTVDAASAVRRHRVLRGRQPEHQLAVRRQGRRT